ncbi:hypothetical protein [Marininema halotolerans]|uniref:Uncharacterized protein n=1 Tax=Marininema halotolerans TaxID=1155944 RepID=A0A1I6UBF7_9BACL|nr:hypothetical protein [Marininema halotolerans]SFS98704.1 hypothetical protein SAMN05444972_11517 [Marininema halotolerans]
MDKREKRNFKLRIVRETFGSKEIKQAFREALEPYFKSDEDKDKNSKTAAQ